MIDRRGWLDEEPSRFGAAQGCRPDRGFLRGRRRLHGTARAGLMRSRSGSSAAQGDGAGEVPKLAVRGKALCGRAADRRLPRHRPEGRRAPGRRRTATSATDWAAPRRCPPAASPEGPVAGAASVAWRTAPRPRTGARSAALAGRQPQQGRPLQKPDARRRTGGGQSKRRSCERAGHAGADFL